VLSLQLQKSPSPDFEEKCETASILRRPIFTAST
jgi:hypothetical protein